MAALRVTCLVLMCVFTIGTSEVLDPLSDEFIDLINSKQKLWKAGRNFPLHTPFSYIKTLMGVLSDDYSPQIPTINHGVDVIANLPKTFDAREKWKNCPSLNEIRDQGACGSCWAFAAVEAMTDRYCVYSNGKQQFHISAQDLLACCNDCGMGCQGGLPGAAWISWKKNGLVSGGNYNSSQGCRPYEIPACEHHVPGKLPPCGPIVNTPKCVKSCQSSYNVEYDKDKRYGKRVYAISCDEEQIKAEIFVNGPVAASFVVYSDFVHYREGVYKHAEGAMVGHHAVKIIGWGVLNDTKYWIVANSWNPDWGNKGFFHILRGADHCGIEKEILAGEPII